MIEDIEKKVDVEIVYALLSGKVTNAINATLRKKLLDAKIDLSPAQVAVLYTLWHKDAVTQKVIAEQTAKDKPSITRILDLMEKAGLVTRKAGKEDRRANIIKLTNKANTLRPKIQAATVAALQDGFHGLSEKDIAEVQRLMKKIFSNIGKYVDDDE